MPGLTQILESARRALNAQQTGMNVTSHNIANANTIGYFLGKECVGLSFPAEKPAESLQSNTVDRHSRFQGVLYGQIPCLPKKLGDIFSPGLE